MSKVKKYVAIIIGFLIALCIFFPTSSKAAAYTPWTVRSAPHVGSTVYTGYGDLVGSGFMYCLQHPAPLDNGPYEYIVNNYVKITGNTAENTSNRTTTNVQNGTMAYIIANGGGYGNANGKNAMWYYKYDWCTANSKLGNFGLFNSRDCSDKNDLVEDGEEYANNLSTAKKVTDNTNKEKIKKKIFQNGNDSYVEAGPFNYTFPGKIKNLHVVNQNGHNISSDNVKFVTKHKDEKGNIVRTIVDSSKIESGKNFYVAVKIGSGVSKIINIKGTVTQDTIYTAEMWFISNAYKQNLLITKSGTNKTDPLELSFDYDIQLTGNIHIEKEDKDIKDYKLDKVKFIIEQVDTRGMKGKGFIQSGGDKAGDTVQYGKDGTYGARETAKVFETSSDPKTKGGFTVYELDLGYKYYFWEIENGHKGYGIPDKPFEVDLLDGIKEDGTKYPDPFKNERVFVDIAGYVWEDVQCGKANILNHVFNSTASDSKDSKEAIGSNVTVKLMKKGENEAAPTLVDETKTTNGEYIFRNTLIKELPYYYIQFEYDGLIYENVKPWKNLLTLADNSEEAKIKEAIITMAIEDKAIGKDGKTLSDAEKQKLPKTYPTDYLTQEDKEKWYQKVVTEKGSKAAETLATRDNFNQSFARVDGIENNANQVSIKNDAGQQVAIAEYTLEDYEAKLNGLAAEGNTLGNMIADTLNTDIHIENYYDSQSVEQLESATIDGFNLGLYKRAQTDIAVGQDLNDVKVSIKGKTAKYTKGAKNKTSDDLDKEEQQAKSEGITYNREEHEGEFVDDVWNVGLTRFETETYQQPVYRADYTYEAEQGKEDQNLKMFFTYKIALKSQSSIKTEINEIVEYYDPNFDVTANGFEVYLGDSKGNKTENGDLTVEDIENTNTYSGKKRFKIIGNGKIQLDGYNTKYLYIKFPLTRDGMAGVFNTDKGEEILSSSVAEITSYSAYKDGKHYATADIDSVADNVDLEDKKKKRYEDDTDDAADAKLYIAEERKVQGIVFEDQEDIDQLENENIRQGNGAYNDGETKIDNVQVDLIEITGSEEKVAQILGNDNKDSKGEWENKEFKPAETTTASGGSYSFEGITPGTYVVRFTWGLNNGGYKVTEYKATIVDKKEYENAVNNQYFYRDITAETQNRNRATDDTTIRAEIDKGLREHKEGGETKTGNNYATPLETLEAKDMVSNSEKMTFEIEHKGVDIDLFDLVGNKKLQYVVNGMNLGIIRRPVQTMTISKRVTNVTVKYSSGEGIIDADIDEQGKISGQDDNIAYIGTSTNRRQAQLKIELDNEVLGNSGTEVTYEYVVTNDSEIDYTSEAFQKFGTNADQKGEIVTLTPAKIMDYIGKESTYKVCDENTNNGWEIVTSETVGEMVNEDVRNSEATKESKMYMTEKIGTAMKPEETQKLNMIVEKRLTSAENSNMTNQVEIIQVNKPNAYNSGSPIMTKDFKTIQLGNYIPEGINVKPENNEIDDSMAETVIIVPSTGGDRNYIPEIAIGLTALITLAGGVYFIRRIVTKKE